MNDYPTDEWLLVPNIFPVGFHHRIGVKSMIFIQNVRGFSIEKHDGHDVWLMVDEYMGSYGIKFLPNTGIIRDHH